jgi:hypothetical protein
MQDEEKGGKRSRSFYGDESLKRNSFTKKERMKQRAKKDESQSPKQAMTRH